MKLWWFKNIFLIAVLTLSIFSFNNCSESSPSQPQPVDENAAILPNVGPLSPEQFTRNTFSIINDESVFQHYVGSVDLLEVEDNNLKTRGYVCLLNSDTVIPVRITRYSEEFDPSSQEVFRYLDQSQAVSASKVYSGTLSPLCAGGDFGFELDVELEGSLVSQHKRDEDSFLIKEEYFVEIFVERTKESLLDGLYIYRIPGESFVRTMSSESLNQQVTAEVETGEWSEPELIRGPSLCVDGQREDLFQRTCTANKLCLTESGDLASNEEFVVQVDCQNEEVTSTEGSFNTTQKLSSGSLKSSDFQPFSLCKGGKQLFISYKVDRNNQPVQPLNFVTKIKNCTSSAVKISKWGPWQGRTIASPCVNDKQKYTQFRTCTRGGYCRKQDLTLGSREDVTVELECGLPSNQGARVPSSIKSSKEGVMNIASQRLNFTSGRVFWQNPKDASQVKAVKIKVYDKSEVIYDKYFVGRPASRYLAGLPNRSVEVEVKLIYKDELESPSQKVELPSYNPN